LQILLEDQQSNDVERDAKIKNITETCDALQKTWVPWQYPEQTLTWNEVKANSALLRECNETYDKWSVTLQEHTTRYLKVYAKFPENTHAQIESGYNAAKAKHERMYSLFNSTRSLFKRLGYMMDRKRNKLDDLKRQRKAAAAELEDLNAIN
jgi:hypothetical protein